METLLNVLAQAPAFVLAIAVGTIVGQAVARPLLHMMRKDTHTLEEHQEDRHIEVNSLSSERNSARFNRDTSIDKQMEDLMRQGNATVFYITDLVDNDLRVAMGTAKGFVAYAGKRGAIDQTFRQVMDSKSEIKLRPLKKQGFRWLKKGIPGIIPPYGPALTTKGAEIHARELTGVREDFLAMQAEAVKAYTHEGVTRKVSIVNAILNNQFISNSEEWAFTPFVKDVTDVYAKNQSEMKGRNALSELEFVTSVLRDRGHGLRTSRKDRKKDYKEAVRRGTEDAKARAANNIPTPRGPAPRKHLR
jgi:hypothetical protein